MATKTMVIKINAINDIATFTKCAEQVDGDVVVQKGRWSVDGRSLMGMFSVDPSTGITVEYPETATEFENYIKNFKVE